jgi:hypothetical protein
MKKKKRVSPVVQLCYETDTCAAMSRRIFKLGVEYVFNIKRKIMEDCVAVFGSCSVYRRRTRLLTIVAHVYTPTVTRLPEHFTVYTASKVKKRKINNHSKD